MTPPLPTIIYRLTVFAICLPFRVAWYVGVDLVRVVIPVAINKVRSKR